MKTLPRILLFSVFGCLLHPASYAQTKPTKVNASDSRALRGVISPLSETQTWKTVFPDKLQYWNKEMKTGGSSATLKDYPLFMSAKMAKKAEIADYTFTFVTEGIKNALIGIPVQYPGGGVVIELTYTFPCVLQVTDKDNNVIKTFVLSDEDNKMTAILHPGFLNDVEAGATSMEIPIVSGFTNDYIEKKVHADREKHLARMEFNAYYEFAARASKIISYGYGYPKSSFPPAVLEVNKKEKSQFTALNEKIESLKSAMNEYVSAPVKDEVMTQLIEFGEYFESNYDPASSPKDVIQLYAFNSAMAYLLGGSPEDAYRQFCIAKPTFGFISTPEAVFEELYPIITDMNNLYRSRQESEVIDVPALTVRGHLEQAEKAVAMANRQLNDAKRQELAARNIADVPGYVMTNDGEKIEGNISIKFIELSTQQILDMDIAKLVWVRGGKAQAFRPKSVSYFMAGDRRFEPMTLPGSAAIKVMGALSSGNIGNNYFMEVVYTQGNYTAYVDPRITDGETYYVKNNETGDTELYSILIKGGKSTEKFLGDSFPEVLAKVKAQGFTSSQESLISFIDALADNAK